MTEIRYRVIADYQASNPDPFSVTADETFQISEKVDFWNGNPAWIWCTDQRGKNGWVSKSITTFDPNGTTSTARSTYTAMELTVVIGDELVAHQEESGWVPLEHLELQISSSS